MSGPDSVYGVAPPALEPDNLDDIESCVICDVEYIVNENAFSFEMICADPELRDRSERMQGFCERFSIEYPQGVPRLGLFTQAYSGGLPARGQSPLTAEAQAAPLELQHLIKSHDTFYNLADPILDHYSQVVEDRELSVLYLGSGAHLSPVLTAMRLIDLGEIDRAHFTYTEINPDTAMNVYQALQAIKEYNPDFYEDARIEGDTVTVSYHGAEIVIQASIRIPEDTDDGLFVYDFFEPEEFQQADLIVVHDIPVQKDDAYADLLSFQASLGDERSRLIVFPDTYSKWVRPISQVPYPHVMLQGPYGCAYDGELGEPLPQEALLLDSNQPFILSLDYIIYDPVAFLDSAQEAMGRALIDSPESATYLAIHLFRQLYYYQDVYKGNKEVQKQGQRYRDMQTVEELTSQYPSLMQSLDTVLHDAGLISSDQTVLDVLEDEAVWAEMVVFAERNTVY